MAKTVTGQRLCFRIVRGFTEISVSFFLKEGLCCDFIKEFIFLLANVSRHIIPLINLKLYELNQFSNISYDEESINEHLIIFPTM